MQCNVACIINQEEEEEEGEIIRRKEGLGGVDDDESSCVTRMSCVTISFLFPDTILPIQNQ